MKNRKMNSLKKTKIMKKMKSLKKNARTQQNRSVCFFMMLRSHSYIFSKFEDQSACLSSSSLLIFCSSLCFLKTDAEHRRRRTGKTPLFVFERCRNVFRSFPDGEITD